jgi:hypothetical protein
MQCPSCGTEVPPYRKFCGICGHSLSSSESGASTTSSPPTASDAGGLGFAPAFSAAPAPPVERRFKALRVIATVYKVLAFLGGGIYGLMGLVALAAGASSSRSSFDLGPSALLGGAFGALVLFFLGVIVFVIFYAAGEFIYLFIAIEENTRLTNAMLISRQ